MMKLDEFKQLTDQEKIELVNGFCDGTKKQGQINKEHFAFTNLSKHMPPNVKWNGTTGINRYEIIEEVTEVQKNEQFTSEEIVILKKIIEQQKLAVEMESKKDDEIKNRSINVYQKQYKEFAAWCKENRITQHDALYEAIKMLMGK